MSPVVPGDRPFYGGASEFGDLKFRDLGPDQAPAAPRYGYRAFGVHAATYRPRLARPTTSPVRGPLLLVDDPRNGDLTGIFQTDYHYTPGVNVAHCAYAGHDAPFVNPETGRPHGCGFYSYGAVDHPDADVPKNTFASGMRMYAHGVVKLTGRRVLGTKGCVAQRLEIVALTLPLLFGQPAGSTSDVRDAYDRYAPRLERTILARYPGVAFYNTPQAMVAAHPLTPLPTKEAA